MEPGRPSGVNRDLLRKAFESSHQGYSADRVITDPELNAAFLAECQRFGLDAPPRELNRALMNLRKSSGLGVKTTRKTLLDVDEYRFAAEIAIRMLERRDGVTLDDVLCDPMLAVGLDELAQNIAPGYTPLEYRWAALGLRKQRKLEPEIVSKLLRPQDATLVRLTELSLQNVPAAPGVYVFLDAHSKQALYVGEASNLRQRLGKHIDHSDNKMLAQHLWRQGPKDVVTEYYVLPGGTSKRELRAIELEQIRSRNPRFNVAGLQ